MKSHFNQQICREWAKVGMWEGLKKGIQLAYGYMMIPLGLGLIAAVGQAGVDVTTLLSGGEPRFLHDPTTLIGGFFGLFIFSIFYVGFGIAWGVMPAAIVGVLSGAILAIFLSVPHIAPHRWNRLAVGVGMGFVIALMVNSMALRVFSTQPRDNIAPYLFFLGIPSVIFVGYCAWLSANLPALVAKAQQPREFPVPAYKQIRFTND